jgi:hypothetical protein
MLENWSREAIGYGGKQLWSSIRLSGLTKTKFLEELVANFHLTNILVSDAVKRKKNFSIFV